jgi:hypothetical protein
LLEVDLVFGSFHLGIDLIVSVGNHSTESEFAFVVDIVSGIHFGLLVNHIHQSLILMQ